CFSHHASPTSLSYTLSLHDALPIFTNFVFWVGIGHAGTLISAILLLFRQKWRMSINRSAEAMTIFAVMCAAIFPLFHMGRIWVGDRKSTRLNSSHVKISYAVFCLKK